MRCLYSALVLGGFTFSQLAGTAPVLQDHTLAVARANFNNTLIRTTLQSLPGRSSSRNSKRDTLGSQLNGDCSPMPGPYGPQISPDTAEAFLASEAWEQLSHNVHTPKGYVLAFRNLQTSDDSANFLGTFPLNDYEPANCAVLCDGDPNCESFTVLVERDPSVYINAMTCPNPPSFASFGCKFFGMPATEAPPSSNGIFIAEFHVVWAGVNVYNKVGFSKRSTSNTAQCKDGPVIRNGGFEMDDPSAGTVPTAWSITSAAPTVTFGLTKPGSVNQGGTYAFVANLLAPESSKPSPSTGFVLSQELNTCPGQSYNIAMDYRFDDAAAGSCSITFGIPSDDESHKTTRASGDAKDNKPHIWITVRSTFKAESSHDKLIILVECVGHVSNKYSIDNVVVELVDAVEH